MKTATILILCVVFLSCHKDEINNIDICPTCTSVTEINGVNWPSKPIRAWFQYEEPSDTFFTLEISEINPQHDEFEDIIVFWKIPYEEGEYRLDSTIYNQWDTSVLLWVHEHDEASATQYYLPLKNGESFIIVSYLNKDSGDFQLEFI